MTDQPLPSSGGTYIRDPETGALSPAEAPRAEQSAPQAEEAAPKAPQPSTKRGKTPDKEG